VLSKITNTIKDGSLGASSSSSSAVFAVVGVSGVVPADIVGISDPSTIEDKFGDGPLRDFLAGAFSVAAPTAYCKALAGSQAGTIGTVTASKSSSGTVSVQGSPRNEYDIVVEILESGGMNEGVFQITKDGVAGEKITIPAAPGTYAIPGTGLTLTFVPGTPTGSLKAFIEGDTYSFSTTAPEATNAEVLAAVDAILAAKLSISAIYIAGVSSSALWAAMASKLAAEEAKNNFLFCYCQARGPSGEETQDTWVNALCTTERGSTVNPRVGVVAGWIEESDAFSGEVDERGALGKYAGRLAAIEVQNNPDWVGLGSLPGVKDILPAGLTDANIDRLQTAGYVAVRRYNEVSGIYFAAGRLLTSETSDFKTIANRRVMDEACRKVVEKQVAFLNADVGLAKDGSPEGLASFKAQCQAPLRDMKASGTISDFEFVVPDGQNILSSETISTKVRIVPRGKMSFIENEISFKNPTIEE
jgi:Protein of unknown function (DUF2586).